MSLDVRAILDGQVWPQNVHDFGGDNVDILDEQLALLNDDERADAAQQVLALLADPDILIRSYAVLSLRRAKNIVGEDAVRDALAEHHAHLAVPGAPMWQVHHDTLWDEAQYRLLYD